MVGGSECRGGEAVNLDLDFLDFWILDLYLGKLSMWLVGVSVEKPEARQSITGTKHDTSGSVAAHSHRATQNICWAFLEILLLRVFPQIVSTERIIITETKESKKTLYL